MLTDIMVYIEEIMLSFVFVIAIIILAIALSATALSANQDVVFTIIFALALFVAFLGTLLLAVVIFALIMSMRLRVGTSACAFSLRNIGRRARA